MPRIVPLQLLRCLKVLLDENGGILSISEVKRIAGLMTKYSKKLVSKCIYVQILKVTKTELLGEFMAVGGWSLVYNWLNDAIRAMNWPLVQEILELLLLCPVDVDRLKINSAPKLVKGLCKDGGNEGVRILAKRLVEQWLKVVTENTSVTVNDNTVLQTPTMTPQTAAPPAVTQAEEVIKPRATAGTAKVKVQTTIHTAEDGAEEDPLADVADVPPEPSAYTLTPAQKKANQAGLVYKIIYKDGQQVLAKVPKSKDSAPTAGDADEEDEEEEESANVAEDGSESADADEHDEADAGGQDGEEVAVETTLVDEDETRTSLDKPDKESESSDEEESHVADESAKNTADEKLLVDPRPTETEKDKSEKNERKTSKDSKDEKHHDKERKIDKEKEKERKSSSSRHTSSSSSHKSKSSSSSSSSKSKSSSSHRSSSDKHRNDREKSSSSSSKDRERSSKSKPSSSKSSSSSSSSTSSRDRHRDKDKERSSTSSSSSKKDKEREKEVQAEKDKDTLAKMMPPSLDKLGKIPKKAKDEDKSESEEAKATSITIPSKKASMSIEIRRDSMKAKTVKTYKSQFRSHGLTEEAPPPPSRKGLKKPISIASAPGTVIPSSLPSSLKRASPPPNDSPTQKKSKIDINNVTVANEKPGAIKLIAPKKIQTLVETNLFSDALSAATGPKKIVKRKRASTPAPGQGKDGASPPTSPDAPKVAPLKFYQDTLDESKTEEKSDKENDAKENNKAADDVTGDKENSTEDDDDIPLKKVKEDIEQKVLREKAAGESGMEVSEPEEGTKEETNEEEENEAKKPGPGCGPNGPPGVLMLHRRKGPKKKLTWRPQEHLEQIRYFELDETERVNVTKTTSFMDMKNMERFSERDAINIARRGLQYEDNMKPQTSWKPLIEVDDVPPHPNGAQSKQRKVQADRETTTLRALYFSHAMIPDSPAEAELEPHFAHDVPVIPLDDITGNPDAVNDFTSMPWPEPKGSPKYGENNTLAGTGNLSSMAVPTDMYSTMGTMNTMAVSNNPTPANPYAPMPGYLRQQFNNGPNNLAAPPHPQMGVMQMGATGSQSAWSNSLPNGTAMAAMMANQFYNGPLPGSPNIDMNVPQQNYMGQFGPSPNTQFMPGGPQFRPPVYNGPPNFGASMTSMMANMPAPRLGGRNNNNAGGGGNWRNFPEGGGGNGGGNSGGNWRPAGSGPNRNAGNTNNGVCKAFMRGHCRLGKSCKFIHPKSKRI